MRLPVICGNWAALRCRMQMNCSSCAGILKMPPVICAAG
ncbi:MAG: hypothetical protein E7058_04115 [Lentisphaerae bacterium]|nr:hypothetical protein [Lentisphaerota bacterium]